MKARVSETHTIKTLAFINPAHGVIRQSVKVVGWNDQGGETVQKLVTTGCYASGRASLEDDQAFICAQCSGIQHIQDGFVCSECHNILCLTHLGKELVVGQKELVQPMPNGEAIISMQDVHARVCANCWEAGRGKRMATILLNAGLACLRLILAPFKAIVTEGKKNDPVT